MQGDVGDGMFFVEDGTVRVIMTKDDNQEKEVWTDCVLLIVVVVVVVGL